MSGERTEKPSQQRRKKASEKGDRLVSRELLSAAAMLAGISALGWVGQQWLAMWRAAYLRTLATAFDLDALAKGECDWPRLVRTIIGHASYPILAVGVVACLASGGIGLVQGGGALRISLVGLKWERVNPAANVKKLFGMQAIVRLGKSILPVAGVLLLARMKLGGLLMYPALSVARLPATVQAVYGLLLGTGYIMLIWSLIDFFSAWRQREQRLRMTKQDVRDEAKETEGSPQIKRRIRLLQRQMRQRKLKADVSRASVVVTNPTHYAVALSFDFGSMEPPRVLAKGRGFAAARIREDAQWAGVPIIENPPLARSLFRTVEEGTHIPYELYEAVAGILAYLYRAEVEKHLAKGVPVPT